MTPHRIAIKIYFAAGTQIEPAKIVPVFHRWIRDRTVEGLLIDVADYKHVHEGPATMLVAHEMDYIVDLSEAKPGLSYIRKRAADTDTLAADIADGLRKLVVAANALALDAEPHSAIAFDTAELRVQIMDRLNYPHTSDTVSAVADEVQSALAGAIDGAIVAVTKATEDDRAPITLAVRIENAPDLTKLYNDLQASTTIA